MFDTYEELNLRLLLLQPNSKRPSGAIGSGASYDNIRTYCSETSTPQYNVGVLHGLSHTCCIDIDDLELFWEWFYEYEHVFIRGDGDVNKDGHPKDERDLLGPAAVFKSGKANRLKLLYRLDKPVVTLALEYKGKHIGELRCVDSRGSSRYDVVPPSIHPDGTSYSWVYGGLKELRPLPRWFERVWRSEAEHQVPSETGLRVHGPIKWFDDNTKVLDYAKEVGFIDVSEGCVNGKWMYCESSSLGTGAGHGITELPIGNKLHCFHESAGFHHPISASDLLGWKLKRELGSNIYTKDTVSTHITNLPEWHEELKRVGQQVLGCRQYREYYIATRAARNLKAVLQLQHLDLPGEFLLNVQLEVHKRQHMKSMSMAAITTLALCNVASAGKFRHRHLNTPTSMYWVVLGETGIGKSIIQNTIHSVLGTSFNIRSCPKSDSGYIKDLQKNPASSHMVDEFGLKLQNTNKNFESVMTIMMELHGLHGGVYVPGSYSDAGGRTDLQNEKLSQQILHPTPSLLAVSTWETLKPCLTSEHVHSGFLARFLPWMVDDHPKRAYDGVDISPWPQYIVDHFQQYPLIETTVFIDETVEAKNVREEYDKQLLAQGATGELDKIRNRRFENVLRLCGAIAATLNPTAGECVITEKIALYAIWLVDRGGAKFDKAVIARDDKVSALDLPVKAIVKYLKGCKRQKCPKFELLQKCYKYKTFKYAAKTPIESRELLLQEGTDRGLFYVDKVRAGTTFKFVVKLPSVPLEGEVVTW